MPPSGLKELRANHLIWLYAVNSKDLWLLVILVTLAYSSGCYCSSLHYYIVHNEHETIIMMLGRYIVLLIKVIRVHDTDWSKKSCVTEDVWHIQCFFHITFLNS